MQKANNPRLTASHRIKHRAVEADAALVHRHHPRVAAAEVGVVAEQELGHRTCIPLVIAVPSTFCSRARSVRQERASGQLSCLTSAGTPIFDFRSSQAGTGNSWARRYSGLNSFD